MLKNFHAPIRSHIWHSHMQHHYSSAIVLTQAIHGPNGLCYGTKTEQIKVKVHQLQTLFPPQEWGLVMRL